MASRLTRGESNEDFGQGFQKEFEATHGLREQTIDLFFTYTSAQGSFGLFRGQAMGSISCAGLTSRVKHSRARKYQHKQDFLRGFTC
jgi:hypothetical protein